MLICTVMEDFMGEGKLCPIRVGRRVLSRWSIEIPEALVVVRMV